jgi:hypothetical protein
LLLIAALIWLDLLVLLWETEVGPREGMMPPRRSQSDPAY